MEKLVVEQFILEEVGKIVIKQLLNQQQQQLKKMQKLQQMPLIMEMVELLLFGLIQQNQIQLQKLLLRLKLKLEQMVEMVGRLKHQGIHLILKIFQLVLLHQKEKVDCGY